jgi:para-aminobenzoate synthetase component 1
MIQEVLSPPSFETLVDSFGQQEQAFILESAAQGAGLGQWSFLGAEPIDSVRVESSSAAGLEAVRAHMRRYQITETTSLIPFVGGAVGMISYEFGPVLESIDVRSVDDRGLPHLYFGIYDGIAAYHHSSQRLYLIAHDFVQSARTKIEKMQAWIQSTPKKSAVSGQLGSWKWNMSASDYERKVEEVRAWIARGDVYQINLSRRAQASYTGSALTLFSAIRCGNPAPYAAFLDAGDFQLISSSPEQFLQKSGQQLVTRPIKGTRPRGRDAAEDHYFAQQLAESSKERAELLMIVDLERNDLGRVAEFGSVHVENLYQLEYYAQVMHQTAEVKAHLAADKDLYDCLEAMFPGGSITGAPKVRAMEIIESLEPTARGAYCGCIGYIGFNQDAEFNIAIRTLQLKSGLLDYQVGAGIVWDSDPHAEYLETEAKGRAIRETLDTL